MARYKIYSIEDAISEGLLDADDYGPIDEDYRDVLIDTTEGRVVYTDSWGDSPEDMYLNRDLYVFVAELNRLAEE